MGPVGEAGVQGSRGITVSACLSFDAEIFYLSEVSV